MLPEWSSFVESILQMKRSLLSSLFVLCLAVFSSVSAYGASNARVGMVIGGIDWGDSLFGLSYDQRGFLQQRNWTLGGELIFLRGGFVAMPRFLIWQRPNLSGFYGGPVASFGILKDGHMSLAYRENYDNVLFGLGGEGGYVYRFPRKFDVGGGLEMQVTTQGMWLGIKIMGGYTF
jgi:hypothetical protein